MFINNKYTKLYYLILEKAKNKKYISYTENHHIIPRCMGGDNSKDNIITISSREHFVCHYLLTKMVDKKNENYKSIINAFFMMRAGSNNKRYMNSRLYESVKIEYSKLKSNDMVGEGNINFGKIWIVNYNKKQNKCVSTHDVDDYISNGWVYGRCMDFTNRDYKGNKIVTYNKIRNIKRGTSLISICGEYGYDNLLNRFRYENNKNFNYPEKLKKSNLFIQMSENMSKVKFNFLADNLGEEYERVRYILQDDKKKMTLKQIASKYDIKYIQPVINILKLFDIE